jgi:hypothetical protein
VFLLALALLASGTANLPGNGLSQRDAGQGGVEQPAAATSIGKKFARIYELVGHIELPDMAGAFPNLASPPCVD